MKICRTAKDLIDALSELPPETEIFTLEPPFTGARLVPQDNGKVMVASLRDTEEGEQWLASRNVCKAAAVH